MMLVIKPALPTGTSIQHVFHYKMDDTVFYLQKKKKKKLWEQINGGSSFVGPKFIILQASIRKIISSKSDNNIKLHVKGNIYIE